MSRLRISHDTWTLGGASFVAYHCDGPEADWNLALDHAGEMLWLAGTVSPAPRSPAELAGAEVTVDLRSLDEVAEALLGRSVTLYPGGQNVCALSFTLSPAPAGVRFAATVTCDWDRALATFPHGELVVLELDIEAAVAALHPGALP